MQSKGFIRVIAILLVLICAFYLSFSFVTKHFEGKAEEYAQSLAKTSDSNNTQYKSYYKAYLDSIAKEKVYLGYYTFQQAREMEVGLGLDLKGGMNVTLQISVPDILKTLAGPNADDPRFQRAIVLTDSLVKKGKVEKDVIAAFVAEYNKVAPGVNLSQVFRGVSKVKNNFTNEQVEKILKEEVTTQIDNSYNVLRTRIDRFGVVSPNIQKMERDGQILLELPGVKEPERVRKLLQGSANLEFYETYDFQKLMPALQQLAQVASNDKPAANDSIKSDSTQVAAAAGSTPAKVKTAAEKKANEKGLFQLLQAGGEPVVGMASVRDTAAVNAIVNSAAARRILPTDLKLAWSVKPEVGKDGKEYLQLVALKTNNGKPALGGDVVDDAKDDFDQHQNPVVSMSMNDEGAAKWARITANNIGKSIAIVLDDQVYSFPRVNQAIEGGRSEISGNFTVEESKDLANVLKSGKMAAKVSIVSESVIGPSLGQQAIERGFMSFVVALVLLMIFMCAIYGFGPGMIANMCLIFNLFFMFGILASLQAVLTLSGIAGIVLSLGMAVDANVLIYERTKEELRAGKNLKAALADGYKNAFSAIFDSNLTSIITGVILLIYGTGPIKGFATTLIIGIACSFFTAVFLSRVVIEALVNKGLWNKVTFTTPLSRNLWTHSHFNFMGKRKIGFAIALVFIIATTASLFVRQLNPGIDFSGGRNYVVQFDHAVKTNDLQTKLAPIFDGSAVSVITVDNDTKVRISTNFMINSTEDNVDKIIMDKLYNGLSQELKGMTVEDFSTANENVGVVSAEKVGPSIAKDITRGAVWAVGLSLLAMALYILLRFRNISFSLGALAAVAFTAYVIIGFYSMFYGVFPFPMEIDQSFIAAILTVIGYQVNDTVVVFDRVRETHHLYPKQNWFDTFNTSLNNTLTRTVMTSLTTFLVLLCIFVLGGETIRSFTFAMIVGVVIGTLASIFVASQVAYLVQAAFERKEAKKNKAAK